MVATKIGAEDVPERVIGANSTFRHAVAPNKSLLWGLERTSKIVSIPFAPSDNSEVDTTFDLPAKAIVTDILVEVVTADVGMTLDVGLLSSESGGDADGLADAVDVGSTGIKSVGPTVTVGSTETYYSANTKGALLTEGFLVGTDVDQDYGIFEQKNHYAGSVTAKSITYTGSAGSDTAAGFIHLVIMELP